MKRTVFIVGAGASCDFGLPIGSALARDISKAVYQEMQSGRQWRPIMRAASSLGGHGDYDAAARDLSGGLLAARSIDRFLASRADDPLVVTLGKCGIAASIASAESRSSIGAMGNEEWTDVHQALGDASGSWLARLTAALIEGLPPARAHEAFANASFITFNYDRCIERYLELAFRHFLRQPPQEAMDLVDQIPLLHVYGSLGRLPSREPGTPYAAPHQHISVSAKSLRTFTEGATAEVLEQAHAMIKAAEIIVILGFGFDRMNVDALFPRPLAPDQMVRATSLGLNVLPRTYFEQTITPNTHCDFHDMGCADLLQDPVFQFDLAIGG